MKAHPARHLHAHSSILLPSRTILRSLFFFSLSAAFAVHASQPAPPVTLPTVSGYALDKQKLTLPNDLEGQLNLLLLSFSAEQQRELETWSATAQSLQHTHFTFRVYRLPVAERENALFRWWANESLRSEESDPELWHWTLPLYLDKHDLLGRLNIPDEKTVVALLVERNGRIVWRSSGAATAEARTALQAAAAGIR